jgi:hypothetical protein
LKKKTPAGAGVCGCSGALFHFVVVIVKHLLDLRFVVFFNDVGFNAEVKELFEHAHSVQLLSVADWVFVVWCKRVQAVAQIVRSIFESAI